MFFVVRSNDGFNFPLGLIKYTVTVTIAIGDTAEEAERGLRHDVRRGAPSLNTVQGLHRIGPAAGQPQVPAPQETAIRDGDPDQRADRG